MADLLPPSKEYKYLIRPDGSIRVRTKAQIAPEDSDFVHLSTEKYEPGQFFWDFATEQMLQHSPAQKKAKKEKADALVAQRAADRDAAIARIKELRPGIAKKNKEMWSLLGKLLEYDFGED